MRNNNIAIILALLSFLGAADLGAAEAPTVALGDFEVTSGDPANSSLGKGFTEIVAFELAKSPAVKLVERARRNALLEEMEFSMSGLADAGRQAEMGKLLSAQYLVFGTVTDMGKALLVSLSMVEVETGQVVWRDQLMESGGKYAYIGAYFGKSILKHFKAAAPKSVELALAKPVEKDIASVAALSAGIDALDKGNKEEAKKQLEKAKKIDPGNAVAAVFLGKLASASAKFKVVPERYVSYYNPAYLAGIEKDRLFINWTPTSILGGYEGDNHDTAQSADEQSGVWEQDNDVFAGYAYPLGETLGLGLDFSMVSRRESQEKWESGGGNYAGIGGLEQNYYSGMLSLGVALGPRLSLGLGAGATFDQRKHFAQIWRDDPLTAPAGYVYSADDPFVHDTQWGFGGMLALACRSASGALSYDLVGGYGTTPHYVFDYGGTNQFSEMHDPLYAEQTLSWSPDGQKTFLALKQVNDLYLDRAFYYGRLMPCAERWFLDRFSIRAGCEGTLIYRGGTPSLGWGATAGATVKLWRFDLDLNYSYRRRPSYSMEGIVVPEGVLFITLTINGLAKK